MVTVNVMIPRYCKKRNNSQFYLLDLSFTMLTKILYFNILSENMYIPYKINAVAKCITSQIYNSAS